MLVQCLTRNIFFGLGLKLGHWLRRISSLHVFLFLAPCSTCASEQNDFNNFSSRLLKEHLSGVILKLGQLFRRRSLLFKGFSMFRPGGHLVQQSE